MVADDDLDMESLQAQVDMSMSFAHNLVTSWIKPTHLAQLRSSGVNAAQIFEEELRRPPRLGVGASMPTAPLPALEASKLKRRLGKNGTKNEDAMKLQNSPNSDDEEHKGRPAKRKTKVDPFGHEGSKKKRKADSEANQHLSAESASPHSLSLLKNSTLEEPLKHNPTSGKGKQRTGPDSQQPTMWISSPPMRLPVQSTFSGSPTAGTISSPSKLSREAYESSRVHTDSIPIPDKANLLGIPLLNLDGPPELTDKHGNTGDLNNSRKKRKRHKKKKTQMIGSTSDNLR